MFGPRNLFSFGYHSLTSYKVHDPWSKLWATLHLCDMSLDFEFSLSASSWAPTTPTKAAWGIEERGWKDGDEKEMKLLLGEGFTERKETRPCSFSLLGPPPSLYDTHQ